MHGYEWFHFRISFHNATYGLPENEVSATLFKPGENEYENAINFDPTELQYSAESVIKKAMPLVDAWINRIEHSISEIINMNI